ncbi:MAG TPA: hypothetical protein VN814_25120 [Caulobacteraceae bacterium]|nr:hypothetical protein [Caulobacteraceae bacterium]
MKIGLALLAAMIVAGTSAAMQPTPPPVDRDPARDLAAWRANLAAERAALDTETAQQQANCSAVSKEDAAKITACQQESARLAAAYAAHERGVEAYRAALAAAEATTPLNPPADSESAQVVRDGRRYTPSGRGLIGGTTWITGFNVQTADPALVARSHAMMDAQMRLSNLPYAAGVDFDRYNFVLGIAASTDALTDLATRVVFDEMSNGSFSADTRELYASLRGRYFDELACHSNGAMVCLAALERGDVVADSVTLYGPQITVESLKMWDDLVRSGKVRSVQVMVNRGDPVPPISLLAGGGTMGTTALASLGLLRLATFVDVIHETAPRLAVRTFACGDAPTLDCHGMDVYRDNVVKAGCKAVPSGRVVPGTAIPGRPGSGALEPPPPC